MPSLLACRKTNESLSNPTIELFEIAKIYLPRQGELPEEKRVLAFTSGGGYREVKGVIELLVASLAPSARLTVEPIAKEMPALSGSVSLKLHDQLNKQAQVLGILGEVSPQGLDQFDLRGSTTVAEIDLGPLVAAAELVRTAQPISSYPPVSRDLNVVFNESVPWADVERLARTAGGELLESISFQDDSYRDAKQLGQGKKSVLFSIQLRKSDGTLTSEAADAVRDRMVASLGKELGGKLRA